MAADTTRSTASSEPTTAARETRTPPKMSAPAGSIAARLAAVIYHPELGSIAAWDAAQWRIALAKANGDRLIAASKVMPEGEARDAVRDAIHDNDEEYNAAIDAALEMPAPHHGALLWKMQYFLAAGDDGFNDQYRADSLNPLFDDVARFAAAERSPTRLHSEWATARAAYVVAREWEAEAEADGKTDSDAYDRCVKRRCLAEEALMEIPSPDASAFAFKFLIAKGGGRETDCWDDMLETEAKRFGQEG